MKKKKSQQVVFKPYTMGQLQLPTDLESLIPQNHLVRVVHEVVEKMDLSPLLARYKGGGTSSYHPKMMLKVLVYAYSQQIYTSRKIAKALRENIYFMWISANNRPDFRTLNRFRGEVMRGIIGPVFASLLQLLIEEGYVKLENYFLDGTKIEANANKYRHVWAKSTRRYKRQLQEKVKRILEEAERINEEENAEYGERDLEEMGEEGPIDGEKLEKKVKELDEILKQKPEDKQRSKAVRQLKKDCLPRLRKYEEQERILGERNSYAKTDHDATYMRMKGDPLDRAQPKAGYNVQTGTEEQFVVGFSIHQQPGDSGCLVPHLEQVEGQVGRLAEKVIADAAYGSEENYAYLEDKQVGTYVKYNTFDKEQRKGYKADRFQAEQFAYDAERDEFLCPAGKRLVYEQTRAYKTRNGYMSERRHYKCRDCGDCLLKPECTQAEDNRGLKVSFELRQMRARARSNLTSEEGKALRSRRGVEVESVFGRIKQNWVFRRFLLRGIEKVEIEWGLLCMAHNMAKLAA